MTDSLGDRMKGYYEDRYRVFLTRRIPVILRIDGKAFHTFTKTFDRPFSDLLHSYMLETCEKLFKEIQGAKLIYTQSDEISILVTDFDTIQTEAWFDYNLQKMCSVAASIATSAFIKAMLDNGGWNSDDGSKVLTALPNFDCRAFNIPEQEVVNYFRWRQSDWERNSVQMLARSIFSHKELQNKSSSNIHEMLYTKGVNWADLDDWKKNGSSYWKNLVDTKVWTYNKFDNQYFFEQLMERKDK